MLPSLANLKEPTPSKFTDLEGQKSWLRRMAGRTLATPSAGPIPGSLAQWLAEQDVPPQQCVPQWRDTGATGPIVSSELQSVMPSEECVATSAFFGGIDEEGELVFAEDLVKPPTSLGTSKGATRRRKQRRQHLTATGFSMRLSEFMGSKDAGPEAPQPVSSKTAANPLLPRLAPGLREKPLAQAGAAVAGTGASAAASSSAPPATSAGAGVAASGEDAPLLLPRVRSIPVPESGRYATMHTSEEGTSTILSRCGSQQVMGDTGDIGLLLAPLPSAQPLAGKGGAAAASGCSLGAAARAAAQELAEGSHGARPGSGISPFDRKWHLRQASLSASLAHGEPKVTAQPPSSKRGAQCMPSPRCEYLCFEGWGLDDEYVRTLFGRIRLESMRHINFADNRLTEATVQHLASMVPQQPLTCLESLRLAGNQLGPSGGRLMATLLRDARPPIGELDLADNGLGDEACEALCGALMFHCTTLVGLCLAKNFIGQGASGAAGGAGAALGTLVGAASKLQALDLHWNRLHGNGALELVKGLHENSMQAGNRLWRVNLAWNRLGGRCDSSRGAAEPCKCSCEECKLCSKVVTTLASVFSDGTVLFHLDLSYNMLRSGDCTELAEALQWNHTLFGLHFAGNEATVDDVGFLVPTPQESKNAEEVARPTDVLGDDEHDVRITINDQVRHTPRRLRLDRLGHFSGRKAAGAENTREMALTHLRVNPSLLRVTSAEAFSAQDLDNEKEWLGVQARVQQPAAFNGICHFEDVRINERCCWICENWVEQPVCYIPGWSGPETSADDIANVYAYFSVDGFSRPSRLSKVTDKFFERHFAPAERNPSSPGGGRRSAHFAKERQPPESASEEERPHWKRWPLVDDKGRYCVFKGSRMLPPSTMPVQVVFQVNESLVTAKHLKAVLLAEPLTVTLHCDGRNTADPMATVPAIAKSLTRQKEEGDLVRCREDIIAWILIIKDPNKDPNDGELQANVIKRGQIGTITEMKGQSATISIHDSKLLVYAADFDKLVAIKVAHSANNLIVGIGAWRKFEEGLANALCTMEDPRQRADLVLEPRTLQYDKAATVRAEWTYERSVFKDYTRETSKVITECFDRDYSLSKLEKYVDRYVKGPGAAMLVMHLRKTYKPIMAAFHARSFRGLEKKVRGSAGLSLLGFAEILSTCAEASTPRPQTSDQRSRASLKGGKAAASGVQSLIFNSSFPQSLADTCFVGAHALDRDNKELKDLSWLPPHGLARFQFLEAFAKIAMQRFGGEQGSALDAVKELQSILNIGQDALYLRSSLQKALFCEECCMVIRQNRKVLEEAFHTFAKRLPLPSATGKPTGKSLSYSAWLEFLNSCRVGEFGLSHLHQGLAFAVGKEIRVDEYKALRHMELSWSEFLVCIGAVVRLSGKFQVDLLPDRLLEFIEEYVPRAVWSVGDLTGQQVGDAIYAKVTPIVGDIFQQADNDGSGYLTIQELTVAFRQKQTERAVKDLGLSIDDFRALFKQIDSDRSGTITLDELCTGLVKMTKAMVGLERTIAFLRKVFVDADADGSKSLSKEEFHRMLTGPAIRAKLQQVGVTVDDTEDLWAAVDAQDEDGQEGISCEEMIVGFLSLRGDGSAERRAKHFLRLIFKEKDAAGRGCGTLSPDELKQSFGAGLVTRKLTRLGVAILDWSRVAEAIDVNDDGELSWKEVQTALDTLWN